MAEQKYLKYFIFQDKKNLKLPSYRAPMDPQHFKRVTLVDKDTVPGGKFFCETSWFLPGFGMESIPAGRKGNYFEEHTHDYGEMMGFYGLNFEDVMDLGAEIEFWIEGKKYLIKESFTSFIPAGVKHGPLTVRNVKRPIAHFLACDTPSYK